MISPRVAILGAMVTSLILGFSGLPAARAFADAERGKLVYETRCSACHASSVHKQGSRKAKAFEVLRAQVLRWSAVVGGAWTADEIDDVTRYLNERYYHLPCPEKLCKADQVSIAR